MGSLTYLGLGTAVLGGFLMMSRSEEKAAAQKPVAAKPRAAKFTVTPQPVLPASHDIDLDIVDEEEVIEEEPEAARGHADIDDPAEFAMVFTIRGTSYVRLSMEEDERASVRGAAKLVEEDGVTNVIAPVAVNAMPVKLRSWSGKRVMVDGTCSARVVGFAEVSRLAGEREPDWNEEKEAYEPTEPWTIDEIVERNVTLAAVLDGCTGTWARASDYSPAAIATAIDAPELETAAITELLADDDELQDDWKSQGGEGRWQDAADVAVSAYQHPLTEERWVFVQAHRAGGCGEPGFSRMAAYRAGADGKLRKLADLDYGYDTIRDVVDLDGDGQPELLLGGGDRSTLVDLANQHHDSISVPENHYGCGC